MKRATTVKETLEHCKWKYTESKKDRTAYCSLSAGFHGNNGLDPSTSMHILKTYVIPPLMYSLEVLLPTKPYIDELEIFLEKKY
jgi:hypothetical protein